MNRTELPKSYQTLIGTLKLSPEEEEILINEAQSLDDIACGLYVLSRGEKRKLIKKSFPNLDLESIGIAKALVFKKRQEGYEV